MRAAYPPCRRLRLSDMERSASDLARLSFSSRDLSAYYLHSEALALRFAILTPNLYDGVRHPNLS